MEQWPAARPTLAGEPVRPALDRLPEPGWGVVRNLRVRLLGDLQVDGCDPARLGRRQVRTLLKVLALRHDQPVALDTLVDCLWHDDPPARPADQVSVLVSRL